MKITHLTSVLALALALLPLSGSFAQEPTPAPSATPVTAARPQGGDRIEQFRQKMNEFLKTSLKVSDEEWSIIQPLLEKVQIKQRDAVTGRLNAFGGRRGGDRGGRPASPETDSLKAALDAENTAPAEIKAKLEVLRAARKKSTAELEQAREELRKVLTQRQEATLVMVGVLE